MERLPGGIPWRLSYQSRVGPSDWLGPRTQDVLEDLAREGVSEVVVVPISFVTDHLETLHEIEIEFAELAGELGFETFRVTRGLNDSPKLIGALATLVEKSYHDQGDDDP
jgi:ferrochelatase